jgi:ribonuclease P protein component
VLRSMSRIMAQTAGDRFLFLRTSRDIEFVKQHGRRLSTACFNLLVCKTEATGRSRVGIVVGKRFGIAVRRNRAKRLFRELTRQVRGELASDHAVLVFPKRDALALPFQELKGMWRAALRRHGLIDAPEN